MRPFRDFALILYGAFLSWLPIITQTNTYLGILALIILAYFIWFDVERFKGKYEKII